MTTSISDLKWRYATKKFDAEKMLSSGQIELVKEAFNLTATSYGLQPIRLVVVSNKEIQKELVKYSFDQKQVEDASHLLVICIENEIDESYITNYFNMVKKVRSVSSEILDPFKNTLIDSFSKKDIEEIHIWSKNQAYIALGNLLNVLASERIDSCPMEGFVADAYDKVLGLHKRGLSSVLALPIGFRADDDNFSAMKKVRKDMEDSVIEIS